MARKSLSEVLAESNAFFVDNTTGIITPLLLRTWINDLIVAIRPAYGLLRQPNANQTVGTTYEPLVFATGELSVITDYVLTPITGSAVRTEAGITVIDFNAQVTGPNNQDCSATLFKNGAELPVSSTARLTGNGEYHTLYIGASLVGTGNDTYQIQVKTTGNLALTFRDCLFLLKSEPAWSIV